MATKYIVSVREVHIQMVEIEADSEEDAIELVGEGYGDYLDNTLELSHTMDMDLWTIEEAS